MIFDIYRQAFWESDRGGVWDDGTMYLYIGVILLVILLGQFAENNRKKSLKFWFVTAATVLSVILGFRGENVGADTMQYIYSFENALDRNFWANSTTEPGYHLLLKILRLILPNSTVFIALISILTVFFVYSTLWKNRKNINLLIAFSFYVGLYFFQALNLLRIYLAAAFVFWNFNYLIEKKYGRFAVVVLLTSLIHYSTLVMLFPLGFLLLYQKNSKLALIAVSALIVMAIPLTARFGDIIRIARYAAYGEMNESSRSVGIMLFFDYLPAFYLIWYVLRYKIKGQWTDLLISLTITGFFIRFIAYYITIAGRLWTHFMGLFVLVIPFFVHHIQKNHRKLYLPTMLLLFMYLVVKIHFYFIGYLGSDAIMPYTFFWN